MQKCAELHELLRLVAFMLFIVGTILCVVHGFTGKTLMLHMVRLFVLTALLVMLPQWGNQVQQLVQTSILNGLGIDPAQRARPIQQAPRRQTRHRQRPFVVGHSRRPRAASRSKLLISGVLWLVGRVRLAAACSGPTSSRSSFCLPATPCRRCSSASWRSVRCAPSAVAT